MARKTLLTLSVSVTLATICLAPTAVFAQFPVLLNGAGRSRRSRPAVLRRSEVLLPWAWRCPCRLGGRLSRAPALVAAI
jgi:hypothetical protein